MPNCKICDKKLKVITNTHLALHTTTLKEYCVKYGSSDTGFTLSVSQLPKSDPRYKNWLKSLKGRDTAWCRGLNKETDPRVKKISETFKLKELDNFRSWRENARASGLIPNTKLPLPRTQELAFLVGLALGDGHLERFPRTDCLTITLGTDKPNLWRYAFKVIREVLGREPYVAKAKHASCMRVRVYQKNLGRRLEIPDGKRTYIKISLPSWIRNERKFLIACLKGLFEAEGSISIHKPTYTYNLAFSNLNTSLLDEVQRGLISQNYHPERRVNAVRLRKKQEVFSFMELIKFRKYSRLTE